MVTVASRAPTRVTAAAAIDSEVMPMPTSTHGEQRVGGGLAADADRLAGLLAGLGGDRDQLQHRGLPRVGEVGEVGGHPVGRHRVLREVVGADGQEVDDLEHPVRPAAPPLGTSTITPALRPRARTLSANSAASATVATIGAITQVSVPVRSAAAAMASSWRSSRPGLSNDEPQAADTEGGVLLALEGGEGDRLVRARRRGCARRRTGPSPKGSSTSA